MSDSFSPVNDLPSAPASVIKQQGWKGVMRQLSQAHGTLAVTNHNQPEAVILSVDEYQKLLALARSVSDIDPLQQLREDFDRRLASLEAPDAGDRLRALIRTPAKLNNEVKVGQSH